MEDETDSDRTGDTRRQGSGNRRFGTGRSFEDLLNEVCRHGSCLTKDLQRIESYLEAVSRKRGNV